MAIASTLLDSHISSVYQTHSLSALTPLLAAAYDLRKRRDDEDDEDDVVRTQPLWRQPRCKQSRATRVNVDVILETTGVDPAVNDSVRPTRTST